MRFPRIALVPLVLTVATAAACSAASGAPAPAINWAVSSGGPGSDDGDGIGTGPSGRVVTAGGFEPGGPGGEEILATSYSKRGALIWTRRYGGPGTDHAFDNDVDGRGNAAITGTFNDSVDFGGPVLSSRGRSRLAYGDAFLLDLNPSGGTRWVRQIGGTGSDGGDEVATGFTRDVYAIGDSDGPATFSPTVTLPPGGGRDSWAACYRPNGHLAWARSLSGPGEQQAHGINPDRRGNVLVTGEFQGTSIFGSHRLDSAGTAPDVYLAKLDRGGRVRWAESFGNGDRAIGRGVDADAKGNAYFGGEFAGPIQLGPTALTSRGGDDSFLAKARPGGRVVWAIDIGGAGDEIGPEVEVDDAGNSYIAGSFTQSATIGGFTVTTPGVRGAYLAKLSPRGRVLWVVQSTDSPYASLGTVSLGPKAVNVQGGFVASMRFGAFGLAGAGRTDDFVAQLRRPAKGQAKPKSKREKKRELAKAKCRSPKG
ncbi:MAG TPA: hypothetical protein VGE91_00785 [Solirubrobacterales bacterium]